MRLKQIKKQFEDLKESLVEINDLNPAEVQELHALYKDTFTFLPKKDQVSLVDELAVNDLFQKEIHSLLETIIRYAGLDFNEQNENNEVLFLPELAVAIRMLGEELMDSNNKYLFSENLFEKVFSDSPLAIVELDEELNVMSLNKTFCEYLGFTHNELKASKIEDFTHPDDIELDKKQLAKIFSGEVQSFSREKRYISKKGKVIWIQLNVNSIYDSSGRVQRAIGIGKDITKEKEVASELIASKAQLSNIYNSTKEMMGLVKVEGDKFTFISANQAAYGSFEKAGISESDYIGSEFRDHLKTKLSLSTEHIDKIESYYKMVIATKEILSTPAKEIKVNDALNFIQTTYSPILNDEGEVTHVLWSARDVSIEHAYNKKLENSEYLLKEAQRIGNFGHWSLNIVTNKLLWSDQQYVIWGIDKNNIEPSYEGFLNSIHPEDRNFVNDAYTNSLKNKTPYSIVHRLLMADGEIKYVRETCETIYDREGNPLESIGLTQDITEKILNDNQLLENERRYRELYEGSLVGMISTCIVEKKVLQANSVAANIFGYDSIEFLKKEYSTTNHFVNPEDQVRIHELIKEEKLFQNLEIPMKRKDGKEIIVQASARINGNTIEGTFIDVTDSKKIEIELFKTNNRLKSLTESTSDGIIVINSKQEVVLWNAGAESLFQFTNNEMIGSEITKIIPDKYAAQHSRSLGKKSINKSEVFGNTRELQGKKKDGTIFPIELNLASWEEAGESFFSGIIRDISERKKSENLIQKSLTEKEVLLKEVHHRVKNNLQIISGLIEMQSYRTNSEEVKSELIESKGRIKSIALMHEQLYQTDDISSVSLGEYVKKLFYEIQSVFSLEKNNISTRIEIDEVYLNINKAIPVGLILNELITNSIKHAFTHENANNIISVAVEMKKNNLHIEFKDNGVGLKVPFNKNKTTSLGFKMIKALASQIESELNVDSSSKGTIFNIVIPK